MLQDEDGDTDGRGAAANAAAAAEARLLPARLQKSVHLDRKRAWKPDEDQTLLDSWFRCANAPLVKGFSGQLVPAHSTNQLLPPDRDSTMSYRHSAINTIRQL
jgi:hypothetical protein